jgi:hypothetical protein
MPINIQSSSGEANMSFPFGEIRHEWKEPYDYWGKADPGSDGSDPVWTVIRVEISSNGSRTTTTATNIAWENKADATYE